MRALFFEILRSVTLAYIYFSIAHLQVNNCYNPSLASLHLPMTSHAGVNDTQLEQQRERLKQEFISPFFKQNKLPVSI